MNDQAKSRELLIKELQDSRKDYNSLKASSEHEIAELNKLKNEFLQAKVKAEKSDRLKTAFLASLSHEIRTPMNGILGLSEVLKDPNVSVEDQQMILDMVHKAAVRLLNIINDLYDMMNIEAGQMQVVFSQMNINEKMEFINISYKSEAERKSIQIFVENDLPDEEAIINSDNNKLLYILQTIVNIAVKVTDSGTIKIGYKKIGNFLEFFVKDMGEGIRQELMEIIFERFSERDILITKDYTDTGLGLAISKAYVEMMGGKIWVESELGKGSTFYFTIPYSFEPEK